MKADLSRLTFDPFKHFTRVLMQQGRVQLDADWNEQSAILLHYLRALASDLIGPHGGPEPALGFDVTALSSSGSSADPDFSIGPGHYYVDGILCELPQGFLPVVLSGVREIEIASWSALDGQTFQTGQLLEILDPTDAKPTATMFAIAKVDRPNQTLTADRDLPTAFQGSTAKPAAIRRFITYRTQPDYTVSNADKVSTDFGQFYLDVWEREMTAVQDDSIREVALGGPDTAARTKVVWQVKVTAALDGANPACFSLEDLEGRFQPRNRGTLRVRARQDKVSTDPCITAPDARYRGPENQLYRVEIHTGNLGNASAKPTFKWSRENGSVVFPIVGGLGTEMVEVETLGPDERFGLSEGDWVEVLDDEVILHNRPGTLRQVQHIDRSNRVVSLTDAADADPGKHPLLRRWDHRQGDPAEGGLDLGDDGAALIVDDERWLDLEDGIQIQFPGPAPGQNRYRSGDYWLIPARTATGDVQWPVDTDEKGNSIPLAMPPDGIVHHYAPLAVIDLSAGGKKIHDCRKKWLSYLAT